MISLVGGCPHAARTGRGVVPRATYGLPPPSTAAAAASRSCLAVLLQQAFELGRSKSHPQRLRRRESVHVTSNNSRGGLDTIVHIKMAPFFPVSAHHPTWRGERTFESPGAGDVDDVNSEPSTFFLGPLVLRIIDGSFWIRDPCIHVHGQQPLLYSLPGRRVVLR